MQITFDTDTFVKIGLALLAIIFVIMICCGVGYKLYTDGYNRAISEQQSTQTTQPTQPSTVVTTSPTPSPISAITFTVLSTSSSGNYEATTTTGQILYCNDYYSWSMLLPRNTYTATISGNIITNIVLIHSESYYVYDDYDEYDEYDDYPYFYSENGRYYQCDRDRCDVVSWKQIGGQRVYRGNPTTHNIIVEPNNVILG
jgi:hypothetical protein